MLIRLKLFLILFILGFTAIPMLHAAEVTLVVENFHDHCQESRKFAYWDAFDGKSNLLMEHVPADISVYPEPGVFHHILQQFIQIYHSVEVSNIQGMKDHIHGIEEFHTITLSTVYLSAQAIYNTIAKLQLDYKLLGGQPAQLGQASIDSINTNLMEIRTHLYHNKLAIEALQSLWPDPKVKKWNAGQVIDLFPIIAESQLMVTEFPTALLDALYLLSVEWPKSFHSLMVKNYGKSYEIPQNIYQAGRTYGDQIIAANSNMSYIVKNVKDKYATFVSIMDMYVYLYSVYLRDQFIPKNVVSKITTLSKTDPQMPIKIYLGKEHVSHVFKALNEKGIPYNKTSCGLSPVSAIPFPRH